MRKICKYCAVEYNGAPESSCCPQCAAEQRKTSLRERTCRTCGTTFSGGPRAWYCPSCRSARQRERERLYRSNGARRHIGDTDICVVCGGEYVVASGRQKYCPKCAPEAVRAVDNQQSIAWQNANTTPQNRRETRNVASAPIPCVICGKSFVPRSRALTCSPTCAAALKAKNHAQYEAAHRVERNEYHRKRLAEKLKAMSPEEFANYRAEVNRKDRENYAKRRDRKKDDP